MPPPEAIPFELPKLRVTFVPEDDTRFLSQEDNVPEYFDVQFCPYQPLDADPVFAAVSKKHVVVCRLTNNTKDDTSPPYSILQVIRDDDVEARNYTCTWSQEKETGKPLLCVAGEDAKIKVYDVIEGKLVNVLIGHGMDINDLITSPINPLIIATASDDTTVRIWSLDPVHAKQPCLCILGGEGHQWSLLTIAYHDTGRYIVSSGHDQVVNLWTLPDLPEEPVRHPLEVHYPHFSTNEVHSGLVDWFAPPSAPPFFFSFLSRRSRGVNRGIPDYSVAFFGDWILSRACHDDIIVLWRIEGFSSEDPPPPPHTAPTTINPTLLTRSAFVPNTAEQCPTQTTQYTRILTFFTPGCGPQFFMRFKLHHVPGQNPVLAFCNANGKIFFWDFARITGYHDWIRAMGRAAKKKQLDGGSSSSSSLPKRPVWLAPIVHRNRGADGKAKTEPTARENKAAADRGTLTDAEQLLEGGLAEQYNKETLQSWDGKYNTGGPHTPLRAHKVETIGVMGFVGRQVAWSPSGEWCVIVGSINLALVLQRWAPSKREAAVLEGERGSR
ncbi:WD40 repeat-like protein [Sodiomyces alkalinus F11]|uniref:WD40 repeat-like protein n=1 Tax=Sodiomyces alkalinus (strain CBS 110278 / VKM F-3762 / F11) TaxID=1314773 RepID=A0A3N2PW82_SODAK|nr:WD40 repeat-like protein [Sodiomyces alkalinus F11]ROT38737.1 WD40 repeat-like protein [Sodiomyces alkalinus F11]